jgi:hypothetical protein
MSPLNLKGMQAKKGKSFSVTSITFLEKEPADAVFFIVVRIVCTSLHTGVIVLFMDIIFILWLSHILFSSFAITGYQTAAKIFLFSYCFCLLGKLCFCIVVVKHIFGLQFLFTN